MLTHLFFRDMTKTALRWTIREEIDRHNWGEPFEYELLADLIFSKHHYCSRNGLKPTQFRRVKLPDFGTVFDSTHRIEGRFDNDWLLVSWELCIEKYGMGEWLKQSLRNATFGFSMARRRANPLCEVCRVSPSVEVDHVDPEFDEMVQAALLAIPYERMGTAITSIDWWDATTYCIPDNSSAVQLAKDAHKTAILRAVCKKCHVKSAAMRRNHD